MFISYEAQLSAKADKLKASLESLNSTQIVPIVHPSPRQWGYRNRAQLKTNGKSLGYLAASSHDIVDVSICPILTEPNQAELTQLREELPNNKWRPKSRQKWVTLDIDDQRSSTLVNQRQPFRQANDDQNNDDEQGGEHGNVPDLDCYERPTWMDAIIGRIAPCFKISALLPKPARRFGLGLPGAAKHPLSPLGQPPVASCCAKNDVPSGISGSCIS